MVFDGIATLVTPRMIMWFINDERGARRSASASPPPSLPKPNGLRPVATLELCRLSRRLRGLREVCLPCPEPPASLPPPSSLLTVAQAGRSASFSDTPRSS